MTTNKRRGWCIDDLAGSPEEFALADRMLEAYFLGNLDPGTFERFSDQMDKRLGLGAYA